ncbi:hypothetical protein Q3G72_010919 [Acer saccharum]|nr:hypothetical protein Q3G72_010919 [Acer saccharum]
MGEDQTDTTKEVSPYGPWLLVSYGKQNNRNFTGVKNGAGGYAKNGAGGVNKFGTNTGARNGGTAKIGNGNYSKVVSDSSKSGFDRKLAGESSQGRHGSNIENRPAKNNLKNGRPARSFDGLVNPTKNRFEILNDEEEGTLNEVSLTTSTKSLTVKNKGKVVLSEITNASVSQTPQLGKGNRKSTKILDKPVASSLEEAMADILE